MFSGSDVLPINIHILASMTQMQKTSGIYALWMGRGKKLGVRDGPSVVLSFSAASGCAIVRFTCAALRKSDLSLR